MPYSNATKQAFADALRKLLEQKPFAKISVSHICEECGMNRKSFYYHFKDKYDLVNWIFDTEITKIFSEEEWKNAGFTWDILEKICEYFYKHRTFYSKVLQIEGQNSFTEHFRDILVPVNRKFLAMVEEEEKGEHEEFYIHFFSTFHLIWERNFAKHLYKLCIRHKCSSFYINIAHISSYSYDSLTIDDCRELPISKPNRKEVRRAILKYSADRFREE